MKLLSSGEGSALRPEGDPQPVRMEPVQRHPETHTLTFSVLQDADGPAGSRGLLPSVSSVQTLSAGLKSADPVDPPPPEFPSTKKSRSGEKTVSSNFLWKVADSPDMNLLTG